MRVSVMPEVIRPDISRCLKVIAKEGKLSFKTVYSYIELSAGEGGLRVRATDPHLCYQSALLQGESNESGKVLIDGARFAELLNVRHDGTPMRIWHEGVFLHVKQGEFVAKLPLLRHEVMEAVDFLGPFELDVQLPKEVVHGITRCLWSIGDDTCVVPGLLLDFVGDGLLRVGTLSSTLQQFAHFDVPKSAPCQVVLSTRCASILETLSDDGIRFAYSVGRAKAFVFSSQFAVRVACVAQRVPANYASVLGLSGWRDRSYPIPVLNMAKEVVSERPRNVLLFNRQAVLDALRSVSVALGKEEVLVVMRVNQRLAGSGGELVVEFIGRSELSKSLAIEKVLAVGDVSSAVAIGVHIKTMTDIVKHVESAEFWLHIGSNSDAIVAVDRVFPHIVVMAAPMRISEESEKV